jgi:hypothetical protein
MKNESHENPKENLITLILENDELQNYNHTRLAECFHFEENEQR